RPTPTPTPRLGHGPAHPARHLPAAGGYHHRLLQPPPRGDPAARRHRRRRRRPPGLLPPLGPGPAAPRPGPAGGRPRPRLRAARARAAGHAGGVAVVGLADQQDNVRAPRPEGGRPGRGVNYRLGRPRESRRWTRSTERMGPAPDAPDVRWIRVADAEADIHDY